MSHLTFRALAKELKLKPNEIAVACDVSVPTVYRVLRGHPVRLDTAQKIARVYAREDQVLAMMLEIAAGQKIEVVDDAT